MWDIWMEDVLRQESFHVLTYEWKPDELILRHSLLNLIFLTTNENCVCIFANGTWTVYWCLPAGVKNKSIKFGLKASDAFQRKQKFIGNICQSYSNVQITSILRFLQRWKPWTEKISAKCPLRTGNILLALWYVFKQILKKIKTVNREGYSKYCALRLT